MAIKFEDRKPPAPASKTTAGIASRFATPIETDDPVNPDPADDRAFGKPPAAEKKSKRRK